MLFSLAAAAAARAADSPAVLGNRICDASGRPARAGRASVPLHSFFAGSSPRRRAFGVQRTLVLPSSGGVRCSSVDGRLGASVEAAPRPESGEAGDECGFGADVEEASDVEVVEYADLTSGKDIGEQIRRAYGEDGLGILLVRGVPGLAEQRARLLPLARALAGLPEEARRAVERPEYAFAVGWSHGVERLEGGLPDTLKGSFYANPISDEAADDADEGTRARHPEQFAGNVWPAAALPELEPAFKAAGGTLVDVGRALLAAADVHVARALPSAAPARLARAVAHRECAMGRLLHYFPRTREELEAGGGGGRWCGWHTDHSAITGLFSALYLDAAGRPVPCPDPAAGLYVRDRRGRVLKVAIPPEMAAFQIGESAQILSGGVLRATPHCVQGPAAPAAAGLSRSTLAVFVQPRWDEPMAPPEGVDPRAVRVGAWRSGQRFVEFAHATVLAGYS